MLINGLPATEISLLDRGLAYGDGLFETILIKDGTPLLLARHFARLQRGCVRFGLELDMDALTREVRQILETSGNRKAVLKIVVTRQAYGRGYRPLTRLCNRILTLHAAPDYRAQKPEQGIAMFVCQQRLARQPSLAGLKHLNRLEQVLASQEWPDDSFMEGLMLDTEHSVIEGTRSNVFIAKGGLLFTPDLTLCGVNGVLRAALLEHFGKVTVTAFALAAMESADEIFIANSVNGVWPVTRLHSQGRDFVYPVGPFAEEAQACFQSLQA